MGRKIVVTGRGGTGKTTTAVNLSQHPEQEAEEQPPAEEEPVAIEEPTEEPEDNEENS